MPRPLKYQCPECGQQVATAIVDHRRWLVRHVYRPNGPGTDGLICPASGTLADLDDRRSEPFLI